MDDQITLRIPVALARVLTRRAREQGVPKSQVVREALRGYLEAAAPAGSQPDPRGALEHFRGAAPLDRAAIEADALARQMRAHNWRE